MIVDMIALPCLPGGAALAASGHAGARAVHGAGVPASGALVVSPLAAAGDAVEVLVGELVALFPCCFEDLWIIPFSGGF